MTTLDNDVTGEPALPGLATGEFDHHQPDFIADPWPTYRQLRDRCPVSHSDNYGGFWLLTRYHDIVEAAADWATFTSAVPGQLLIPPGVVRSFPFLPLEYDPPEHTVYRQLVAPTFAPRRVNQFADDIGALAGELLAPILADGGGDLVPGFSAPLTTGALALFIGLPQQDRGLWVDLVRRSFEGSVRDPVDAARAGAEFRDYIDALVASRRAEPTDDLISELIAAEVDGVRLDDDQIRGFMLLVLVAGHETTASSMSYALWHLATHPSDLERLRAEPELMASAVEEFIRLSSPVSIFARNASADTEFHGSHIRSGDLIGLSFSSANRDERAFEEPEVCKLDRRPNRHLAFGSGVHFCLGANMARRELSIGLTALLDSGVAMQLTGSVRWKGRGDALSLAHLPIGFGIHGAEETAG